MSDRRADRIVPPTEGKAPPLGLFVRRSTLMTLYALIESAYEELPLGARLSPFPQGAALKLAQAQAMLVGLIQRARRMPTKSEENDL